MYDVAPFLEVHHAKSYPLKKERVRAVFVHHSGGDNGKSGVEWAKAMSSWHVHGKDWAGIAYQYAISYSPTTHERQLVIMKTQRENVISNHTKGCNKFSIGVVLQGHLGKDCLSGFQVECMEALFPWLALKYNLDLRRDLGWHSNCLKWGGVPKLACPGKYAVSWLRDYVENC